MVGVDAVTNVTLASERAGTLRIVPHDEDHRGPDAMLDLRDRSSLKDIRATLAGFAALGDDRRTNELRAATRGLVDLSLSAHRDALLAWLRQWGCRHLRTADNARSSRALLSMVEATCLRHPGRACDPRSARSGCVREGRPRARGPRGETGRPAASRRRRGRRHLRQHRDREGDVRAPSAGLPAVGRADAFGLRLDGTRPVRLRDVPRHVEGRARGPRAPRRSIRERTARAPRQTDSTPARIVDEYLWMRLTHER